MTTPSSQRVMTWAGLVGLLVAISVQSWTLTISPTVWQDEAQTIDIGRQLLESSSPETVWFEPGRAGLPQLSYLGPLLLELAFRIGGETLFAPRLAALLAAAVAGIACLVWLRRLGVPLLFGWLALFWLYLDPAVERSYRGARADTLAMALAFAACVVISGSRGATSFRRRLVVAGAIAAVLPWIWLPAFLLWPLIGVAVWHARSESDASTSWLHTLSWGGVGALAGTAAVMLPVSGALFETLAAMRGLLTFDATVKDIGAPQSAGRWDGVWASIRYAPWLPVIAAAGAVVSGRIGRGLALAAAAVALVVIGTRPYLYRYVYLVPYLIVLSALACARLHQSANVWSRRAALGLAIGMALWCAAFALVHRTQSATIERDGRDPGRLVEALERTVGRGPRAVYVETLGVYYAGRSLGWQMYRPSFPWRPADVTAVLEKSDAIVTQLVFDTPERRARFAEAGFDAGTRVDIAEVPAQRFRYGGEPYGPFLVFLRVAR